MAVAEPVAAERERPLQAGVAQALGVPSEPRERREPRGVREWERQGLGNPRTLRERVPRVPRVPQGQEEPRERQGRQGPRELGKVRELVLVIV